MKHLISAILIAMPLLSAAECIGSGSYQTCYDNKGNSYDVMRLGNTTYVDGRNSSTGNRWSQESTTIGNTTYHDGRAANGNRWNSTSQNIGGTTYYNGSDSRGNSFGYSCDAYGCR